MDDPICKTCGHARSSHAEEMPYECFDCYDDYSGYYCECPSFSYVLPEAANGK